MAIIRGHQEEEEKGSDSDSFDSQEEEGDAPKYFNYEQEEQLDNLVDSKMVLDFLNSGLDEKSQLI